ARTASLLTALRRAAPLLLFALTPAPDPPFSVLQYFISSLQRRSLLRLPLSLSVSQSPVRFGLDFCHARHGATQATQPLITDNQNRYALTNVLSSSALRIYRISVIALCSASSVAVPRSSRLTGNLYLVPSTSTL